MLTPWIWWPIIIWLAVTAYLERSEHDPIFQLFTALVLVILVESSRIREAVRRGRKP
jgi:hypothetical protein